jgi:Bor protein
MKRLTVALITGVLALTSAGCFKHTYSTGTGGDTAAEPKYSEWHTHWLGGTIGEGNASVSEVCPSGNATIKDEVSFVNGLVGGITLGIYYPTTVEIYCGSKTAKVDLSAEDVRAIANDPRTRLWLEDVKSHRSVAVADPDKRR